MRCPRGLRPMGSNSNSFHATLRMSDQSIQELMADLQKVLILNITFHDGLRSIFSSSLLDIIGFNVLKL